MGGTQSQEYAEPEVEGVESAGDIVLDGDLLTLKLPPEDQGKEPDDADFDDPDWDEEEPDGGENDAAGAATHQEGEDRPWFGVKKENVSPESATIQVKQFTVKDPKLVAFRPKPDAKSAAATGNAPSSGDVLSGMVYTINNVRWVQLQGPLAGLWTTSDGLAEH